MKAILLGFLGWICGYFLGSGLLRALFVFGVDLTNMPFLLLLFPYVSAFVLAIALPVVVGKNKNGD